jgi:chromosome segregation ATPase
MPSRVASKRHERDIGRDSSPHSLASARNSKRARLVRRNDRPTANGGDSESDSEDNDEDGDEVELGQGGILPPADVDFEAEEDILTNDYPITPNDQPHAAGSIVRIEAVNFVTYTHVQLFPGPSLNMVIGPNGTGKSTIVCAICLGLGWGPQSLGRSKEVSDFVKHGSQEAVVEIELQGNKSERNPVFRREITRAGNSSKYFINGLCKFDFYDTFLLEILNSYLGKSATAKKYLQFAQGYNIQIDNLCQFLPQDRVAEFAQLPHTELLKETQRAVSGPDMLEMHNTLVKLGKSVVQEKIGVENEKQQLHQYEARQAILQQDVDRLRERELVIKTVERLERTKPFVIYRDSRAASHLAKAEFKAAEVGLRNLIASIGPAMEKPKQKKRYKEAVQATLKARKDILRVKQGEVFNFKSKVIPALEEKIKRVSGEIETENRADSKRRDEARRLKTKIEDMKKKLEGGPPEVDLAYYNKSLSEKGRELRDLVQQAQEMSREDEQIMVEVQRLRREIEAKEHEKERLESVAGQRELLMRREADTWKVWEWYQKNKHKFELEILPPPILSVSVKDPKYVDAIEQLIRSCNLAFLCQTRNDYFALSNAVFGKRGDRNSGLGVTTVTIKNFSGSKAPTLADQAPPPFNSEQLADLGFEGFVLDFLEGPAPILNMLCHDCGVGQTPITMRKFTAQDNQRCEIAGLGLWLTGQTMMKCTRRYGAMSTAIVTIPPATIYKTQPVDVNKRREIEKSISELRYQHDEMHGNYKQRIAEKNELKTRCDALKAQRKEIESEKSTKQLAHSRYIKQKADLENAEGMLEEKRQGAVEYKATVARLEERHDALAFERADAAVQFVELVAEFVEMHNNLLKLRMRHAEACSDEKNLENKNKHILRQRDAKEKSAKALEQRAHELKRKAYRDRESLMNAIDSLSEEDRRMINETPPDKTVDAVQEEIDTEKARLNLIHEGNPNAIKQYEERARAISALQGKIEKDEATLQAKLTAIKEVQNVWEPKLDALVTKISAAFSKSFQKIGCAGEVQIFKSDEGYDKWAIQIMVKFRENEKLQVLNNQRQSGGERAVSTVFYLMALQSLAKSPFRVVDEINQGMDPRNERVVHHRMVNIACQEYTSQYVPLNVLKFFENIDIYALFIGIS